MQDRFSTHVLTNNNNIILDRWEALALPDGRRVDGCLFQTVWNLRAGRAHEENTKGCDPFDFDKDDLSETGRT